MIFAFRIVLADVNFPVSSVCKAGGAKEVIQGFGVTKRNKNILTSHWLIFLDLRINKRILPSSLYNYFVLFVYVNPTPEQKPVLWVRIGEGSEKSWEINMKIDQNDKNIIVDFDFFLIRINNKLINRSNHIFEYYDFDGKISRILFFLFFSRSGSGSRAK